MPGRFNILRKLTVITSFVIAAASGNAAAQDINNPVLFYYETPSLDGTVDSILSTKVTFDPLPRYGSQTRLTIEHYAQFSTENGMMVELRGEAVDRIMLRMPYYAKSIPGPITKGDTLVVEFLFTPEQVGMIPLSMIIYDNIQLVPNKSVRVGVMDDIPFILGADGDTFGVASAAVSPRNSTVLGPAADLLSVDRVFHVEPKYPQPDLQWLDLPQRPNYNPEEEIFALEVRVQPVADQPNQRRITCRVSPYQDFEHGIAFQVSHSAELSVTELDSCILGAVKRDSVYEFSFTAELVAPGLGSMAINCVTPNSDFGVEGALFSKRPRVIGADLRLTFGIDEDLKPLLITDVPLKPYLKATKREKIDPLTIDQRFAFVEQYWKEDYEMHTVESPRFNFVMIHVKP